MSRIRSIKPEFWTSAQVMECSTNARLLFIGIWNFCDDEGRHPYSPRTLKALVFPGDPFTADDVAALMENLAANGLIECYATGGKEYFQVTGWRHQKIDKPQDPKHPDKNGLFSKTDRKPVADSSSNVRDGGDGIGEDRKGKKEPKLKVVNNPERLSVPALPESDLPAPIDSKPKKRFAYHAEFDAFWKAYPTDQNMSKPDAYAQWRKLCAEDRELALTSCPAYRAYCQANLKSGYRAKHADGYLKHRKFEGHAQVATRATEAEGFFVKPNTPQWDAWRQYNISRGKPGNQINKEGTGWWFTSEWPPTVLKREVAAE